MQDKMKITWDSQLYLNMYLESFFNETLYENNRKHIAKHRERSFFYRKFFINQKKLRKNKKYKNIRI